MVPWLRGSVDGLSTRSVGFDSGPVHVVFIVDRVTQGQVYPWVRQFFTVSNIPSALHPSSSTCCSYQQDERTKLGNLPKRNALSEIGKNWTEKYFLVFSGGAMAQAISRSAVTVEVRFRSPVCTCEICGRQNGVGQVLLRVLRFCPANILPPVLHTHLYLHVAVTRRTTTWSLRTFRKATLNRKSMSFG